MDLGALVVARGVGAEEDALGVDLADDARGVFECAGAVAVAGAELGFAEAAGGVEEDLGVVAGDAEALVPVGAGHVGHDEAEAREALEDGSEVVGHAVDVVAGAAAEGAGVAEDGELRLFEAGVEGEHSLVGGEVAAEAGVHFDAHCAEGDAAFDFLHQCVGVAPGSDVAADEGDDAGVLAVEVEDPGVEVACAVAEVVPDFRVGRFGAASAALVVHIGEDHVVDGDECFDGFVVEVVGDALFVGPAPVVGVVGAGEDDALVGDGAGEVDMDVDDGGQHFEGLRGAVAGWGCRGRRSRTR